MMNGVLNIGIYNLYTVHNYVLQFDNRNCPTLPQWSFTDCVLVTLNVNDDDDTMIIIIVIINVYITYS